MTHNHVTRDIRPEGSGCPACDAYHRGRASITPPVHRDTCAGDMCGHPLTEHNEYGCTRKLLRGDWCETPEDPDVYCGCTTPHGITSPEPRVRPVRYHVSLLEPEDDEEFYTLTVITVAYRGDDRWAVYEGIYDHSSLPRALNRDGEWEYEGSGERANEDWLGTHRFPLDEAVELAKKAAITVGVYSHRDKRMVTASDVLARKGQSASVSWADRLAQASESARDKKGE